MQNTSSPLDQLADIHLPAAVSWWPLAPGWWLLLALAVIAAIGVFFWRKRQRRNRYRLLAQQELQKNYARYNAQQDAAHYLQNLSVVLRRTALSAYPTLFNGSVKGEEWLAWLDSTCPPSGDSFLNGSGRALLIGPYQKNPHADIAALQQLGMHWLKHHKTSAPATASTTAEASHV